MRPLLAATLALTACADAATVSRPAQVSPSPDAGTSPTAPADASPFPTGAADADASPPLEPDAGPSVVHDCSSLPAPGTWTQINPPNTGPSSFVVATDPHSSGTVWVMMTGGIGKYTVSDGLYRSDDCGVTWSFVSTGANATSAAHGPWTSMYIDPVDQGTMYITPIYGDGGVWKSTNGGVDWTQLIPPDTDNGMIVQYNFYDSIGADPNDHLHLVVGTHANCTGAYAPICAAETKDGGQTWHYVTVPGTGWIEGGGVFVVDEASWLVVGGDGIYLTTDNGATFGANLAPQGTYLYSGGEVETHPMLRGADGSYFLASGQGVVQSKDTGRSWSLLAGQGPIVVGMTIANGRLYAQDGTSSAGLRSARLDALDMWDMAPSPPLSSGSCEWLDFDPTHNVLYASCFDGGVWREVLP
jgi:hypothetical protein